MKFKKTGRWIILILAICCMGFSLCACSESGDNDSPLTGTWKLDGSYDFDGSRITEVKVLRYEGDDTTATLDFNKDDTYELVYKGNGNTEKTYTGTYKYSEDSYYLTLNKDKEDPLTIMYYDDAGESFSNRDDGFLLITMEKKSDDEEENRFFYRLRRYK